MLHLPIGRIYNRMKTQPGFGLLPLMATHSRVGVSTMLASSFCERMNSAGNLLVTKKTTRLNTDMVDKRVTLRMNADIMAALETRYKDVDVQQMLKELEDAVKAAGAAEDGGDEEDAD